ncbi:DUF6232 family protein [Jidongwangia harbinensis]|uniref:DUF6232 family protein n=1 Tax=Jidongwangia harbinensis TaxID=2878561 RepID=UPI001CDA16B4|nr:DUF6232 family protein [Jidongwangia harbinensis]MCA2214533.1 DUF6232 family protein [Jidongwangia harbinensis]
MRTRTYYRGPDAVVTNEVFVWRTAPPKVFVIRDLRDVCIAREDNRLPTTAHVAGGSLVLIAATGPMWNTPGLISLGLLAVAVPGTVVATACWRTRPRRRELRATYRGAEAVLYVSLNARVFNQVSRALRRSVEDNRPDWSAWDGAAAA